MPTHTDIELVNQLTPNKLALVQALLRRKDLAFSGVREVVRARCLTYLDSGELGVDELKSLLESLDLWGNQRIRFIRISDNDLLRLQDEAAVTCAVQACELANLLGQELPLIVEAQVSPISIRYTEDQGKRTLLLIAGKIQEDYKEITTLPELPFETVASLLYEHEIPDNHVVYRPFLRDRRKIVSFAEIDLDTGNGIVSVKSSAAAGSLKAKFEEICWAFDPLLDLSRAQRVNLRKAISCIDNPANDIDLKIPEQYMRDDDGAVVKMEASSGQGDVRQNPKLQSARHLFSASDSGDFCRGFWNPCDGLTAKVHTYIYGADGEVGIRGQASEENIRYVLHRINQLNG